MLKSISSFPSDVLPIFQFSAGMAFLSSSPQIFSKILYILQSPVEVLLPWWGLLSLLPKQNNPFSSAATLLSVPNASAPCWLLNQNQHLGFWDSLLHVLEDAVFVLTLVF